MKNERVEKLQWQLGIGILLGIAALVLIYVAFQAPELKRTARFFLA